MSGESMMKVIIDTDCGVDDAMAIMLALCIDNVEVVAITCTYGNTILDNVSNNVLRVLNICQKKIPVYKGSRGPLIVQDGPPSTVYGSDGLGDVSQDFPTGDLKFCETSAAIALVQLAKQNPQQIRLLALGPLTNIALAHRLDPEFTSNLKDIFCLGGSYKGVGNITEVGEFNFFCDPEAANVVMTETKCSVTLVPWETVTENGILWDYFDRLVEVDTPKGHFLKSITYSDSTRRRKRPTISYLDCDVLAVVAAIDSTAVTSTVEHFVVVEHGQSFSRGLTIMKRTPILDTQLTVTIVTGFKKELVNQMRLKMLQ